MELLSAGETTEDHRKWQKEETELVERDRKNEDHRVGGLFRGGFRSQHPNLRAIRDDEDGVERCPSCTWELEYGVCLRCEARIDDEGIMRENSEDFSDLDDMPRTTDDEDSDDMDITVDMDRDSELGGFNDLDDDDISLDGDGRPIHMIEDYSEDDYGHGRAGANDVRGLSRPHYWAPGTSQVPRRNTGIGRRPDFSSSGSDSEDSEQDLEAGSLDDFIVNDEDEAQEQQNRNHGLQSQDRGSAHGSSTNATTRHRRNLDNARQTGPSSAHELQAGSYHTPNAAQPHRAAANQLLDEEESDEGGGISNGRRRVRSEGIQPHGRTPAQHLPGAFNVPGDSEDDGISDGATDTLLQAGWSQLSQDDRADDDLSNVALSPSGDDRDGDAAMGRSDSTMPTPFSPYNMHSASSNDAAHRYRSRRRHRAHVVDLGIFRPRRSPLGLTRHGRERRGPESNSVPRNHHAVPASHQSNRRGPSLPSVSGDARILGHALSDEEQNSDQDTVPPFSPMSANSLISVSTSELATGDGSRPRLDQWSQSSVNGSERSGSETPSGLSSRAGNRASSDTATIGRSSPVITSAGASSSRTTRAGQQSPIYIDSSPVKSDPVTYPVGRASRYQRSASAIPNDTPLAQHRDSSGSGGPSNNYARGRPHDQSPAAMLLAWHLERQGQNQGQPSRPSIRGGGPSTGASLFPQPRHSADGFYEDQHERELDREITAKLAAEKSVRRRAKELRKQNENPFASAHSRLSQASRLFGEAAELYSGMQGQGGHELRAVETGTPDTQAVWEGTPQNGQRVEMW